MSERRYPHGRPAEGAMIYVPAYGTCEVLPHSDPSLIALRTPNGATVRIGHAALRLALLAADDDDARPTT